MKRMQPRACVQHFSGQRAPARSRSACHERWRGVYVRAGRRGGGGGAWRGGRSTYKSPQLHFGALHLEKGEVLHGAHSLRRLHQPQLKRGAGGWRVAHGPAERPQDGL
jgi:hypothetical protein